MDVNLCVQILLCYDNILTIYYEIILYCLVLKNNIMYLV